MKKNNRFKNYIKMAGLMLVLIGSSYSCNKEEGAKELFEDSATVRFNKREVALRALLKSSPEGWKTTYFTDDKLLGGYTFIFDFEDDKNVRMVSDLTEDITSATSKYDIIVGSTIKLSFATKNKIHELSDSNNFPDAKLKGKGYKGDFEFLYYGQDGEDLIFKSNRDYVELRFTKATAADWAAMADRKAMVSKVAGNPSKSVFRRLTVGDKRYDFNYNSARRFVKARNLTLTTDTDVSFGVGFTPTGIVVSPALEVNGKRVHEFVYDADKYFFAAVVDGKELATISYDDRPLIPLLGYKKVGTKDDLIYNELAGISSSSPAFLAFLAGFRADLAPSGVTLATFNFRNLKKNSPSLLELSITGGGTAYKLWFYFKHETRDDKLFLIPTGDTNAPASLQVLFKPLLNILFTPAGHYVQDSGKLKGYSNGTLKFIPADNTKYAIHFYGF